MTQSIHLRLFFPSVLPPSSQVPFLKLPVLNQGIVLYFLTGKLMCTYVALSHEVRFTIILLDCYFPSAQGADAQVGKARSSV